MDTPAPASSVRGQKVCPPKPGQISKTLFTRGYRVIAFDWDGTAVPSRQHPAHEAVKRVEVLCRHGIWCAVITGTNLDNINRQFFRFVSARAKARLLALMNRGSEAFGFGSKGEAILLHRRKATEEENAAMDEIAMGIRDWLRGEYGLETEIIFDRLNRRKIDLIPLPDWADPPKARIAELLRAVKTRLKDAGVAGGIKGIIDRVEQMAAQRDIDLRLTTDVKHVELGLTDKSDSVAYILDHIAAPRGIPAREILFLGDEFGPIDQFEGSDFKMFCAPGAVYISVGKEPNGVPEGVLHYGRGVPGFMEILDRLIGLDT